MGLYEINNNRTIARGNGFKFFQINKLTIEMHSNLSHINIQYYSKLRIPIMHRKFLLENTQSPDCIRTFCIEEIHFFLHVVNGIYIIIHNFNIVYLHEFKNE